METLPTMVVTFKNKIHHFCHKTDAPHQTTFSETQDYDQCDSHDNDSHDRPISNRFNLIHWVQS